MYTCDLHTLFLAEPGVSEEVGSKFLQLAMIRELANVPPAFCLKGSAFRDSLPDISKAKIANLLQQLKSNGGYHLNRLQKDIQAELDKIEFLDSVVEELRRVCESASEGWVYPIIIRSSSAHEDKDDASGAGIYQSIGGVTNLDQALEAVRTCWHSTFSLSALAHRLRIGAFELEPLPGLIIQLFITPDLSGVTFSVMPTGNTEGIFTEYAEGKSDVVESGTGATKSFLAAPRSLPNADFIISENDLPEKLTEELIRTATVLKAYFKKEIEYEWAYAGEQLYTLQVRPITTVAALDASSINTEGILKVLDLYQNSQEIAQEDLGDIRGIFDHSINKRKPIREFAEANNVSIYGAAVIILDRRGVESFDLKTALPLNRLKTPLLTIDLGPYLRSFYSRREDLKSTIRTLTSGFRLATPLIIREFASGEFSAVSAPTERGAIVEVCRGSLIGLNRGFVNTQTFRIDRDTKAIEKLSSGNFSGRFYDFDEANSCFALVDYGGELTPEAVSKEALIKIADFTLRTSTQFGKNMLEWTLIRGEPIYVDNTPQEGGDVHEALEEMSIAFLSPGKIQGKALCITNLAQLEYISSGPTLNVSGHLPSIESNAEIGELLSEVEGEPDTVIVSKFPYTALSVLVGKVKGFVVESGPMLCHLAIICRENKTPVAIIPNALSSYMDGDPVDLQTYGR